MIVASDSVSDLLRKRQDILSKHSGDSMVYTDFNEYDAVVGDLDFLVIDQSGVEHCYTFVISGGGGSGVPIGIMETDFERCLEMGANVNADDDRAIKLAAFYGNLKMFTAAVKHGGNYRCLQASGYLIHLGIDVDQVENREQLLDYLGILGIHQE